MRKGRVAAGGLIAADLGTGKFYEHEELIDLLASENPYQDWLSNVVDLEAEIGPGPEPRVYADRQALLRHQTAAGITMEDLELIIAPMAELGKEAIGSMRDDTPPAVPVSYTHLTLPTIYPV